MLPLQTAPKKNGGHRLITDCQFVNNFLNIPRFAQWGIKDMVQNIKLGDLLSMVDLQDGFLPHWSPP